MKSNIPIVVLCCVCLLWLALHLDSPPAGGKAMHTLESILKVDRYTWQTGEQVIVSLEIANRGENPVLLLIPDPKEGIANKFSFLTLSAVSSGKGLWAREEVASATGLTPLEIPAGKSWKEHYILQELFGELPENTYTVFSEYWCPKLGRAIPRIDSQGKYSDAWQGRFSSNHLQIKIVSENPLESIERHSSIWKESTEDRERLKALLWLKDNAIESGMSKEAVRGILGAPTMEEPDAWTYRIGLTGIWIQFEQDKVKRTSGVEF